MLKEKILFMTMAGFYIVGICLVGPLVDWVNTVIPADVQSFLILGTVLAIGIFVFWAIWKYIK